MKYYFCIFLLFCSSFLQAQLTDQFSDGDFNNNPVWFGDITSWNVHSGALKSVNTVANSQFYLSTNSSIVRNTEWNLSVTLQFNTSSLNYVDVYLVADEENIKSDAKNGYFVRIGGSKDEISLYKRVNGVSTILIDGTDEVTNKSMNTIALKVTCDEKYTWNLQYNPTGQSNNYMSEGMATDSSVKVSKWFGILVSQSTSSFFQKHIFDNIQVKALQKDTSPPTVLQSKLNEKSIELTFDEDVDSNWVHNVNFFQFSDGNGSVLPISSVTRTTTNFTSYTISLVNPLYEDGQYTMRIFNAKDHEGNVATSTINLSFLFAKPTMATYKQIVISELMPDPVPAVTLPEKEYIEIFNTSNKSFDLKDYVLSDPSIAVKLPSYVLSPNEYLILCKISDTADFKPYGKILALPNMPSLNNSSDVVTLNNANGKLVDKVAYFLSWYKNAQMDDGGYALELIDPQNKCLVEENWTASTSATGGTPGALNAVKAILQDLVAPKIVSLNVLSPTKLQFIFSEKVDSSSLVKTNFSFSPTAQIKSVVWKVDSLNMAWLELMDSLPRNVEMVLNIAKLKDCAGNLNENLSTAFALPEKIEVGDVLINEVLFDPLPYGADFVELANITSKYIDLKGCMFANLKNDSIGNKKVLFSNSFILKPNQYLALTTDKNNILNIYAKAQFGGIEQVASLPTYYDDMGNVIFLDPNGNVLDRFDYNQSMHSPLVAKKEGVSLEKINLTLATNDPNNWTSASKESGYATPGYANSQYLALGLSDEDIYIEPQLITPNGDGNQDFMVVGIRSDKIGTLRNIIIYDVMGREVKKLLKNSYLGTNTWVQWDGTDESNNHLPVGHYILWMEAVDTSGNVFHYKKKAVVGARF